MNKFLMASVFLLVLLAFFVSAKPNDDVENRGQVFERVQKVLDNRSRFEMFSTVRGLERAMVVADENAVPRLRINLERWQEKHRYNYSSVEVGEVTYGNQTYTVIGAHRTEKFLWLFGVKFNDEYIVDEDGEVLDEKIPFFAKLFWRRDKFSLQEMDWCDENPMQDVCPIIE